MEIILMKNTLMVAAIAMASAVNSHAGEAEEPITVQDLTRIIQQNAIDNPSSENAARNRLVSICKHLDENIFPRFNDVGIYSFGKISAVLSSRSISSTCRVEIEKGYLVPSDASDNRQSLEYFISDAEHDLANGNNERYLNLMKAVMKSMTSDEIAQIRSKMPSARLLPK